MKKEKITIDELLTKIPNKYELAIVSGKIAKKEFAKGKQKSEIMDEVFKDIMDDEVEVIHEIDEEHTEKDDYVQNQLSFLNNLIKDSEYKNKYYSANKCE